MSIKAIGIVLDAPISPPTNKLTAVVLADWCNDEGGSLYPSMSKIAAKVGVSRSQAQRIVHGFVDQGLLSVVANGAGGKPGVTPRYQMHLDRIAKLGETGSTHATGRAGATGRIHAQEGSHGCGETGSTHATQTVNEPSANRQREGARKKPKTVMPQDFDLKVSSRVETWAAKQGFSDLEAHLAHFVGKARANGYVYANWDDALMNAIRDDWAKLRSQGTTSRRAPSAHSGFASKNYRQGVSEDGSFA